MGYVVLGWNSRHSAQEFWHFSDTLIAKTVFAVFPRFGSVP
jgi:hypothetical protein